MPDLVLGPMLRYVDENAATIWVETDRPCEVEIRGTPGVHGARARTFQVRGHHYALVVAGGLQPGAEYEYQVALDGVPCWPVPDAAFPPSVFVTPAPGRPARIVFGSCRHPMVPETAEYGADALAATAAGLAAAPPAQRPSAALLIGDQVYGDTVSPEIRRFIASRRDPDSPPGAIGFTEYRALYAEAWAAPPVRWLLSVLPTVMMFDDHDMIDDWNTSATWRADFQAKPWWHSRLTGAYATYWVYQHLGNLSPAQLDADETWQKVRAADGDAGDILDDLALRADRREPGIRWSVRRDFGGVRVVLIDSRSRRVVDDDRRRRMVDEAEWAWVTDSVTGDFDHVLLATSVPLLLPRGIHDLEAWSEAVCAGAWGSPFARLAERLREAVDLEHWAAFGASFDEFSRLLAAIAAGAYGSPPATVTVISGDVHHSYLSRVSFPPGSPEAGTAVWQAVCSPIRNVMSAKLRRAHALATSAPGALAARAAARLAGARQPGLRWNATAGTWFDNMLATLSYDGRAARLRFDRAEAREHPVLVPVHEMSLQDTGG